MERRSKICQATNAAMGVKRSDARSAPFSAVKKEDRDQQNGLICGERRQRHGDGRGDQQRIGIAIDGEDVKRGGEQPEGDERQVRFERCSIDDEGGSGAEEQSGEQWVRAETAGQRERAEGGDKREQNVSGVEGDFRNAFAGGDQQREEPGVERRMGLSAHIDIAAHEDIGGVLGMKRLNLRVSGLGEIEDVVALEGLVEKRQAQSEDDQRDEDELPAQDKDSAPRRACGAGA